MRKLLLLGGCVVVVLALVVVLGLIIRNRADRTDLTRALGVVPAQTQRLSFTDWSLVRHELGVAADADPTPKSVTDWLNRAYDKDLSAASTIDQSAAALQKNYGFSPGNAQWEAYAQSDKGAAMVLRLTDAVDFDVVAENLSAIGYQRPGSATGVWNGGVDLVASLDSTLTPEMQYVVLLPKQHLVITSDTSSYAAIAGKAARGKSKSLADTHSVTDMVGRIDEPAAATLWARDFACSDLAMSQADPDAQKQANQLIRQAGTTSPLSGLVMALAPDRVLTVAEEFDSGGQARENLRARARLAVGTAVGRGEDTFDVDFKLVSSKAVGSTVLLGLRPRDAGVFPLSSLYDGPVIFATC